MKKDTQLGAFIRRLARKLLNVIDQRFKLLQTGFPAIVEGYLDPIPIENGEIERGVLASRVLVRPKDRKMNNAGEKQVKPRLTAVPINGYKQGAFLKRPAPWAVGDEVWVECSQTELARVFQDDEYRHPGDNIGLVTLDNAVVQMGGLRMTSDPYTPAEALDADYYAIVDKNNNPVGKITVNSKAEVEVWLKKLVVHCPEIHLGKENACGAIRNCNPPPSQCVFISLTSDYREGLTEPLFYEGTATYQGKTGEFIPTIGEEKP